MFPQGGNGNFGFNGGMGGGGGYGGGGGGGGGGGYGGGRGRGRRGEFGCSMGDSIRLGLQPFVLATLLILSR